MHGAQAYKHFQYDMQKIGNLSWNYKQCWHAVCSSPIYLQHQCNKGGFTLLDFFSFFLILLLFFMCLSFSFCLPRLCLSFHSFASFLSLFAFHVFPCKQIQTKSKWNVINYKLDAKPNANLNIIPMPKLWFPVPGCERILQLTVWLLTYNDKPWYAMICLQPSILWHMS